ncbi:hypothetical protein V8E36_006343 [Tilletia maclaganii]
MDTSTLMNGQQHSTGTATALLTLHRVRFLDWQPSPITAIAFAPLPQHVQHSSLRPVLAIARQNGNIELCQWSGDSSAPSAAAGSSSSPAPRPWLVDSVIVNPYPTNVQSLCFVLGSVSGQQTLRLFSISGGAVVTEHALPPAIAAVYHRHAKEFGAASSSSANVNPFAPVTASSGTASSDPRFLISSRSLPSHAGTVWSISPSPLGTKLAIGCEDGRVRLIDIAQGRFQHLDQSSPLARRRRPDGSFRGVAHTLDRVKGRVMSLAWGPPQRLVPKSQISNGKLKAASANASDSDSSDSDDDDEEDDSGELAGWTETFLLGGTSASNAVMWEVATGQTLSRLQTPTARTRSHIDGPTVVWSCAVLPDGTAVLGDSTGRVTFYDGRTRVPIPGAAFASHGTNADVLALCVGPDGKTVYSGGVDQRVVEYTLIASSVLGGAGANGLKGGKWIQSGVRRLHAHDIRALAIEPEFDMMRVARSRHDALSRQGDRTAPLVGADDFVPPRLPILASGGLDFHLVLTPAAPPTSLQARDASGRTAATLSQNEDDDEEEDELSGARSPSKRRVKGSRHAQGRAADGLDAERIAHTARHHNPISTTILVNFADTTQRRVPFVPLNSLGAGTEGGSLGSALAGGTVAAVLKRRRWIVLRREKSVAIWALTRTAAEDDGFGGGAGPSDLGLGGGPEDQHNWTKLLDVQPKLRSQIVTAAIDPEGRFLAVSDLFETKLFALLGDGGDLVPSKVGSFAKAFPGLSSAPAASTLAFSPAEDQDTLVLCTHRGAWIHVVRIEADGDDGTFACTKIKSFAQHRSRPTWLDGVGSTAPRAMVGRKASSLGGMLNGTDTADSSSIEDAEQSNGHHSAPAALLPLRDQFVNVLHSTISPDGRYLATLDDSKRAHVFSLETLTHIRVMPSLAERPSALIWRKVEDGGPLWLVALLPSGQIQAWDIESGPANGVTSLKRSLKSSLQSDVQRWSKAVSGALVPVLSSIKDPAVGLLWLPPRRQLMTNKTDEHGSKKTKKQKGSSTAETMLVWGPNWLCTVVEREEGREGRKQDRRDGADSAMEDASVLPNGINRTPNGHGPAASSSKTRRRGRDASPSKSPTKGGSSTQGASEADIDALRFETRLNFRYASLLLIDTVGAAAGSSGPEQEDDGDTSMREASAESGKEGEVELVVVERPFFDLVPSMAPAYHRGARYGS